MPGAVDPVVLLRDLIRCRSLTPSDGGALDLLAEVLGRAGFATERVVFSEPGTADVANLFATLGDGAPHLAFAGHVDVVPPGEAGAWRHDPFAGTVDDGVVYGRGAVDMKGGIACFVAAVLGRLSRGSPPGGAISLLITADEEGPAVNGTAKLLSWAAERGARFDAALVGEPTNRERVGDTVKVGRRGSLSGTLTVHGRQGHVAYPHLAENPIPALARLIGVLQAPALDEGTAAFDPSNLEIVGIDSDGAAWNVVPAQARARFNIRYNDLWTPASLEDALRRRLAEAGGGARWSLALQPQPSAAFLTEPGPLVTTLAEAITALTGGAPQLSTSGGTSDARFIKDYCPVVEFGLVGRTMHQVNECVPVADLRRLTAIYARFLHRFLTA